MELNGNYGNKSLSKRETKHILYDKFYNLQRRRSRWMRQSLADSPLFPPTRRVPLAERRTDCGVCAAVWSPRWNRSPTVNINGTREARSEVDIWMGANVYTVGVPKYWVCVLLLFIYDYDRGSLLTSSFYSSNILRYMLCFFNQIY